MLRKAGYLAVPCIIAGSVLLYSHFSLRHGSYSSDSSGLCD